MGGQLESKGGEDGRDVDEIWDLETPDDSQMGVVEHTNGTEPTAPVDGAGTDGHTSDFILDDDTLDPNTIARALKKAADSSHARGDGMNETLAAMGAVLVQVGAGESAIDALADAALDPKDWALDISTDPQLVASGPAHPMLLSDAADTPDVLRGTGPAETLVEEIPGAADEGVTEEIRTGTASSLDALKPAAPKAVDAALGDAPPVSQVQRDNPPMLPPLNTVWAQIKTGLTTYSDSAVRSFGRFSSDFSSFLNRFSRPTASIARQKPSFSSFTRNWRTFAGVGAGILALGIAATSGSKSATTDNSSIPAEDTDTKTDGRGGGTADDAVADAAPVDDPAKTAVGRSINNTSALDSMSPQSKDTLWWKTQKKSRDQFPKAPSKKQRHAGILAQHAVMYSSENESAYDVSNIDIDSEVIGAKLWNRYLTRWSGWGDGNMGKVLAAHMKAGGKTSIKAFQKAILDSDLDCDKAALASRILKEALMIPELTRDKKKTRDLKHSFVAQVDAQLEGINADKLTPRTDEPGAAPWLKEFKVAAGDLVIELDDADLSKVDRDGAKELDGGDLLERLADPGVFGDDDEALEKLGEIDFDELPEEDDPEGLQNGEDDGRKDAEVDIDGDGGSDNSSTDEKVNPFDCWGETDCPEPAFMRNTAAKPIPVEGPAQVTPVVSVLASTMGVDPTDCPEANIATPVEIYEELEFDDVIPAIAADPTDCIDARIAAPAMVVEKPKVSVTRAVIPDERPPSVLTNLEPAPKKTSWFSRAKKAVSSVASTVQQAAIEKVESTKKSWFGGVKNMARKTVDRAWMKLF